MGLLSPGLPAWNSRCPYVEGVEDGSGSSHGSLDDLHEDGLVGAGEDEGEDGLAQEEEPHSPGEHERDGRGGQAPGGHPPGEGPDGKEEDGEDESEVDEVIAVNALKWFRGWVKES